MPFGLSPDQQKDATRLLRSGVGVKETARRVKARDQQVSRLRASLGLPARPIEAMQGVRGLQPVGAGQRVPAAPRPARPAPDASVTSEGSSVPTPTAGPGPASVAPVPVPGKAVPIGTPGLGSKGARARYGRLLRSQLPIDQRVSALVDLATQDANPQARMRALERADELSGFAPDPTPQPDPTPLFTLPPDSMLPFPAVDLPPIVEARVPSGQDENLKLAADLPSLDPPAGSLPGHS